jgi:hypothetical protein
MREKKNEFLKNNSRIKKKMKSTMWMAMLIGINANVNLNVGVSVKGTSCSDCEKTRDLVINGGCESGKECGTKKYETKSVKVDDCNGCEECVSCKKSCVGVECDSCSESRLVEIPLVVCENVTSTMTVESTSMREITVSSTSVETLYSTVVETYYSTITRESTTETPYVCAVETEVYSEVCTTGFGEPTTTTMSEQQTETGVVIVNDSDRSINVSDYTIQDAYAISGSEKLVGILVVMLCVIMM